ncbi:DUF4270 family protein [Wenyingzhuangia sp. 2_MG-2023]|uniref:DUF4270 family protein n=1 Tax=Wenyingzhuangia sp. 2_MG-2023 TaxID=3062639 RepID=UPI0026E3135B|nr:DUF4270 family protein [Wenyingzhuangia sp. 2_MG-2023]MDO6736816.1 DUF4270 family protein [Wenyingzhuangia sp. 2_MG-2023]
MILFNKRIIKTISALGTVVFFMSCANDVPETTGGLINNNDFIRDTAIFEPVISTKVVEKVSTSSLGTYLLGDYTNSTFGNVKAGLVGQITPDLFPLKRTDSDTPENVVTDNVEARLEFPLTMVVKSDDSEAFEIANFLGDYASEMTLTVSTFTTFLERYNADGSSRIYYSDGTNNAGSKEDLGGETVLGTVSGITFKESYTVLDTLKIPLNSDSFDFKTDFLDKLDDLEEEISTNEAMKSFFKGLKITATNTGNGFVLPFDLSKGKLRIDYTNKEGDEEEEKDSLFFNFNYGALYNLYTDNQGYLNEPNKAYVQGAGGYEMSMDLNSFIQAQGIDDERFINQVTLKIYVDNVDDKTLTDFYIYGVDSDGEAVAISDYSFFGSGAVDGVLRYDDTENETDPYVRFFITDLIKSALADGEINELRIKAREGAESSVVDLRSTTAKGAVFITDVASEKAPKLEMIFSKMGE